MPKIFELLTEGRADHLARHGVALKGAEEPGVYGLITARPATTAERRAYQLYFQHRSQ